MSSTIPPVLIELQLETARISAQMKEMQGKFEGFGSTVTKQTSFMDKFKAAAAGMFAGNIMTQGLNMVTGAVRAAVADAQQYEVLMAKTEAVIKSTGGAAGISAEEIKKQAAALESVSAVNENVILNGQNVIATFTNIRNVAGEGNDIFNQTTQASLDLSAALGQDMQSSAIQLGKALNDPVKGITALTRVGVTFSGEQKNMIKALVASGDTLGAQKVILAEMNKEFGGAAAAAGDTFAGAVFRAKDKVQDFSRDLVTNLQPILLKVGQTLGDMWSKYLAPLFGWINKNKEALLIFVGVLGAGYVAFQLYNGIMAIVKTTQAAYAVAQVLMSGGQLASIASTNGLAASMLKLNATMAANPVGLIVAALALLAAGFVIAWNHSETFRKVVIAIAKGVITYIAFMIRAWGGLIEIILKVVTGPMRLFLNVLQHLPGIGKYAKAGLDMINKGIEGVGNFADTVAGKIEGFKDTLDGLANKKIALPKFGGGTTQDGTVVSPGVAPDSFDNTATAAKTAKQKADALKKAKENVTKIYKSMNDVIAGANEKRLTMDKAYEDKINELHKNAMEADAKLRKEYAAKAVEIEEEANKKRASVIQKSKDLLINAFQGATKLDLADLMKDSDQSGATMALRLREKYRLIMTLQKKAAELASKGFSQAFIQDIISQGPLEGAAMADAILNSTPETITEIKTLYNKVQDASENGVKGLAETMYEGMGLATTELKNEYAQIGEDLTKALADNELELANKIKDIQSNLQDALMEAQNAYQAAIAKLNKDTMDELIELQEELKKTATAIIDLEGRTAGVKALANSPAAPILSGVTPLTAGNTSTTGTVYNYNTTVNGYDLSDPTMAAKLVDNTIRYGSTQALSGKMKAIQDRMVTD